jgi:hypothetical protein
MEEHFMLSSTEFTTMSTGSRKEVVDLQAEREAEIKRLGELIAVAQGDKKSSLCSELLAVLGFIHDTPEARARWEGQ